ncbi:MAG: DUF983 domain-containing protein, partial [Okeania sp. SIO2H7]|nr:DUF983 domain-containing protein [Okeania sp. SIO2H7]
MLERLQQQYNLCCWIIIIDNFQDVSETLKINDICSHCGTKYRMEPSFFYGSMYVSYGVGIAFAVAAFVISYVMIE